MGKTSRRRAPAAPGPAAVVDAATPSAAPADGTEPYKPASMVEALFAIDRWEQVVLMFLCVSVTMNFLGNYIPGLQVLMESEVVGYLGSVVSVTGMCGLAYSLFGPGQSVSRLQATMRGAKGEAESAEASAKRKGKKKSAS